MEGGGKKRGKWRFGFSSAVNGPLTPALSLGERELKADCGGSTDGDRPPLSGGEGAKGGLRWFG